MHSELSVHLLTCHNFILTSVFVACLTICDVICYPSSLNVWFALHLNTDGTDGTDGFLEPNYRLSFYEPFGDLGVNVGGSLLPTYRSNNEGQGESDFLSFRILLSLCKVSMI